jgi:signal transduction histidine kinase
MIRFQKYSIKAKLILIQLFITFIVLLLFSIIIEIYKMRIYKTSITEELGQLQKQQLIQADKMATLGILVSGVAHEINNPNNFMLLNSNNLVDIWNDIKSILDRLFKSAGDFMVAGMYYSEMYDDVSLLLNGIVEGAERIKNIVKNLKDFARQDTGRMDELMNIKALPSYVL